MKEYVCEECGRRIKTLPVCSLCGKPLCICQACLLEERSLCRECFQEESFQYRSRECSNEDSE
jgi:hypothetical protein